MSPNGRLPPELNVNYITALGPACNYFVCLCPDVYVHERAESKAFDRARERRMLPVSRSDRALPQSAETSGQTSDRDAAHRDTLFRHLKGIRAHDCIALSTLMKDYDYDVTARSNCEPTRHRYSKYLPVPILLAYNSMIGSAKVRYRARVSRYQRLDQHASPRFSGRRSASPFSEPSVTGCAGV